MVTLASFPYRRRLWNPCQESSGGDPTDQRGQRDSRPSRIHWTCLRLALGGALLALGVGADLAMESARPAGAARPGSSASFTVAMPGSAAFDGDAPDPDVVTSGAASYAFTTGTALGNHIQVLVDTSGSSSSGWHSTTGQNYGSSALPAVPSWEQVDTQTSPGVFYWNGHWIMYYDAAQSGHAGDTGYDCLSVATAATLSPTGAVFTDTSTGPLVCDAALGGAIDPSPFIDTKTGIAYLVWKSNDGGSTLGAKIWSQQLSADGMSLVGAPTELLDQDSVRYPWEATVENPQLIEQGNVYLLLFSAGLWDSGTYSEAYVLCTSPTSLCTPGSSTQVLTSSGSASGPGGGSVFRDQSGRWLLAYAAWRPGCTDYACGGARRLFVGAVTFNTDSTRSIAATPSGRGYWLVAADGGVTAHGDAVSYGSMAGMPLASPVNHVVATADGKGYWLVAADGGVFAFGDAGYFGSMGGHQLNEPVVAMTSTRDGGGYWLVAADGGVFAFGDAVFHGSMGGLALDAPVIDIARDSATGGYWEVAVDGGVFAFDAPFLGSVASIPHVAATAGIDSSPSGAGYRLVGADGGVFAFGDAPFRGSMGGSTLNAPVVGITSDVITGGYWEVATDGGVFAFGVGYFGSG